MDKIKGSLTAKLGPLPAWLWGVLLGLAIIAARWAMSRRGDGGELPVDDPGVSGAEGAAGGSGGGATGVPSAAPNPGAWVPDAINPTATEELPPVDNQQWLSRATTAVVKSTGVAYSTVLDALSKVLAGQAITPVEESYYSRAVAALGYPPGGAPAIVRAGTVGGGAQPPVVGQPGPPVTLPPAFTLFAIDQGGNVLYSVDKAAGASYEPEAGQWYNDPRVWAVRVSRNGVVGTVRGPRPTGPMSGTEGP